MSLGGTIIYRLIDVVAAQAPLCHSAIILISSWYFCRAMNPL
jgi:hypothetical protein